MFKWLTAGGDNGQIRPRQIVAAKIQRADKYRVFTTTDLGVQGGLHQDYLDVNGGLVENCDEWLGRRTGGRLRCATGLEDVVECAISRSIRKDELNSVGGTTTSFFRCMPTCGHYGLGRCVSRRRGGRARLCGPRFTEEKARSRCSQAKEEGSLDACRRGKLDARSRTPRIDRTAIIDKRRSC